MQNHLNVLIILDGDNFYDMIINAKLTHILYDLIIMQNDHNADMITVQCSADDKLVMRTMMVGLTM